jgi:hypothetical protein
VLKSQWHPKVGLVVSVVSVVIHGVWCVMLPYDSRIHAVCFVMLPCDSRGIVYLKQYIVLIFGGVDNGVLSCHDRVVRENNQCCVRAYVFK